MKPTAFFLGVCSWAGYLNVGGHHTQNDWLCVWSRPLAVYVVTPIDCVSLD